MFRVDIQLVRTVQWGPGRAAKQPSTVLGDVTFTLQPAMKPGLLCYPIIAHRATHPHTHTHAGVKERWQ
eukprot:7686833-Pyramimonas_sp.AAC.1